MNPGPQHRYQKKAQIKLDATRRKCYCYSVRVLKVELPINVPSVCKFSSLLAIGFLVGLRNRCLLLLYKKVLCEYERKLLPEYVHLTLLWMLWKQQGHLKPISSLNETFFQLSPSTDIFCPPTFPREMLAREPTLKRGWFVSRFSSLAQRKQEEGRMHLS